VLVVGEKEQSNQSINARTRDGQEKGEMSVAAFLESVTDELAAPKLVKADPAAAQADTAAQTDAAS
jgi:threonyl-tRNA synthetase